MPASGTAACNQLREFQFQSINSSHQWTIFNANCNLTGKSGLLCMPKIACTLRKCPSINNFASATTTFFSWLEYEKEPFPFREDSLSFSKQAVPKNGSCMKIVSTSMQSSSYFRCIGQMCFSQ